MLFDSLSTHLSTLEAQKGLYAKQPQPGLKKKNVLIKKVYFIATHCFINYDVIR